MKYCLKPEPKAIIPCGSTIILLPLASMAESNALRSTPFANPLTTSLLSATAFFAMLLVKSSELSFALRDPTIAIDCSCKSDLFPFE